MYKIVNVNYDHTDVLLLYIYILISVIVVSLYCIEQLLSCKIVLI